MAITRSLPLAFVLVATLSVSPLAIAPAGAKEAEKVDAHGEKLICRREAEIGSLIPRKKRCYTRAEWDAIATAARDNATRMVQDGTARPSGQ